MEPLLTTTCFSNGLFNRFNQRKPGILIRKTTNRSWLVDKSLAIKSLPRNTRKSPPACKSLPVAGSPSEDDSWSADKSPLVTKSLHRKSPLVDESPYVDKNLPHQSPPEDKSPDDQSPPEDKSPDVEESLSATSFNMTISNVVKLTPQQWQKIRSSEPNHIKRPLNAFMAFSKLHRNKITNDHPFIHHALVSKQLGEIWKSFSAEQKKPFYDEAKRLAEEHFRKYPGYKYKPKPRRTKVVEPLKSSNAVVGQIPVKNVYNFREDQTETTIFQRARRISPTQFHAWSLIYESEEEEEGEEELEDID